MPVGYIRDLGNICLIRLVRQMKYFRVVKDIDFMFVTFTAVSRPLLNKALFMYLVFYEYAYLGMVFYSGKVQYSTSAGSLYYLMNFNDYPASIVVLFQQMIVNNWFVVVDMLSSAVDFGDKLTKYFFISFWIINVLILVNIIIAVVLEIQDSLSS